MDIKSKLRIALERPWLKYPLEALRRFGKNQGALAAAGLAFFVILALAPASLLATVALSFLVKPSGVAHYVHTLAASYVPSGAMTHEVSALLDTMVARSVGSLAEKRTIAFWVGLISLVWSAMQVFIVGSVAMNIAFETTEKRSWLRVRLIALGVMIGAGLLVTASIAATGIAQALVSGQLNVQGQSSALTVGESIGGELFAVLLNAAMFAVAYKVLPAARIDWRTAAVGGAAASVLFEIAKKGLAAFLLRPNHGVYGGFADAIVLLLWIYYSATILILGCEAAAVYARNRHAFRVGRDSR